MRDVLAKAAITLWLLNVPVWADVDNLNYLGHNEQNAAHLMDAEMLGNRAYVSVGVNPGLEVYDISNPSSPQRLYQEDRQAAEIMIWENLID